MKILATSDWHLGNLFHGNDRLPEHKHFFGWLLETIKAQSPDALLVAGDVFDNGNPSAAAQEAYYSFLADVTEQCPTMQIIITAGNHDSANRLEAPRALLARYHMEVRGNVRRTWMADDCGGGSWQINYDDLMIPVRGKDGDEAVVLAVPYLRNDMVTGTSYSEGVNAFLRTLTAKAREQHPGKPLVMMAHMYAKGADIARDSSEKIIIGGQEEVNMEGWKEHPDYLTCGHIHKRQHIWNTDWARYTGSVLPMSFAEKDYVHGVDVLTLSDGHKPQIEFLEYTPQHKLRVLPENDEELTPKKLQKLIQSELKDRTDGKLDDGFEYLVLKVKLDKMSNDDIKELEALIDTKNAVLCKIQKIIPALDLTTITGSQQIHSIDDILNRDPLDTLKETFAVKHNAEMSEHQEQMLKQLLESINL